MNNTVHYFQIRTVTKVIIIEIDSDIATADVHMFQ